MRHRSPPLCAALLAAALGCAGDSGDGARAGARDWPALEDEAVQVLTRYVQLDTSNPPGNERSAADFFQKLFERDGIASQIYESAPGRASIVARLAGNGTKPAVVLLHHMDVVPAQKQFWKADPFAGEIRDSAIWGRGAVDDKGMGAASAITLLALAREHAELAGDVIFLGVADEEAGGALGAGFMVEQHFDLFANAGVVLNEGGYIATDAETGAARYYAVETAQKVPLWLRLTASGTPGHGSLPRADSAPNRLLAALARIQLWSTPVHVVPEVERFYADTAHLENPKQRERLRDLRAALADRAFAAEFTANPRQNAQVRNTISLTVLAAGNKTNVIPPEASAELDVRLLPDQDPQIFLAELTKVIADDKVRIETLLSFPSASSPTEHELFAALSEIAARRHPGAVISTPLATGFTDCHYFRVRGIACYGFLPFELSDRDASLVHGNDERISIANLKSGTQLLYELVSRLAGAKV
ncbi:MAG: M20/M25/M40 family metallo-hydrolase [Deltaproteobacteria bacterium]|nr:MAG: M20/M25/M40 family metallo-hydrolase [Deltaproteobacteria bacterium]